MAQPRLPGESRGPRPWGLGLTTDHCSLVGGAWFPAFAGMTGGAFAGGGGFRLSPGWRGSGGLAARGAWFPGVVGGGWGSGWRRGARGSGFRRNDGGGVGWRGSGGLAARGDVVSGFRRNDGVGWNDGRAWGVVGGLVGGEGGAWFPAFAGMTGGGWNDGWAWGVVGGLVGGEGSRRFRLSPE